MMKQFFSLALPVFFCYQSFSQKPIQTIAQLVDSVRRIVKKEHLPGLMMGITTKDSVLFSGGFGYADLEGGRPLDNRTLCRLGSITKSFVALGILKLVEQGKLRLNDRLKLIAPEVPFRNPWESDCPVEVINLLEQTTGFDDVKMDHAYSMDTVELTNKDLIMLHQKSMVCRWRPGEMFSYSNVNYIVLGYIIKKLTGLEYEQYLTKELLAPLGMANTNFNAWGKYPDKEVKEYIDSAGKVKQVKSVSLLFGPAASLWSCADDMVKFLQLFLRNGKPVLSEGSIISMETPFNSLAAEAGLKTGYAKGNAPGEFGYKSIFRGHQGSVGTCRSAYLYSHEVGIGFVLSCNGRGSLDAIEDLIIRYFERDIPERRRESEPLDKTAIGLWLGYYQYETPRFDLFSLRDRLLVVKMEIEKDTLQYNFLGKKFKLVQTSSLTFREKWANFPSIVFARNRAGQRMVAISDQYFEKVSGLAVIGKLTTIILLLLITLGAIPLAIVSIIACLSGKLPWRRLPIMILPVLSIASFIWGFMSLSDAVDENYLAYQLHVVSPRSLGIFLSTLLFGCLTTLHLILVLKNFRNWRNRFVKWWLLLTALSLFLATIILLTQGWIGLRTWAI
jgi:CubicO group peptidase (beta-lactamase class C family)